jgi:hypothetical protein
MRPWIELAELDRRLIGDEREIADVSVRGRAL